MERGAWEEEEKEGVARAERGAWEEEETEEVEKEKEVEGRALVEREERKGRW